MEKYFLRPAIGTPVEAKFVSIPLSLWMEDEVIPYVEVHSAVVEGLHEEALFIPKIFNCLKKAENNYLGGEEDIILVKEIEEQPMFNVQGKSSKGYYRDKIIIIPVKKVKNNLCSVRWESIPTASTHERK